MKKWFAMFLLLLFLFADVQAEEKEEAEFYGVIGRRLTVRRNATEESGILGYVEAGTVVDVYVKGRNYTRIAFNGGMGYVRTKYIEMVQRKDPFEGPMPGTSEHVAVGVVRKDLSFLPEGYRYAIQVSKGTLLSIHRIKGDYAYFPYRREPDDVRIPADSMDIQYFVPWQDALPGDLIYAFTTFFSTSANKEGNLGRVYNISLAAQRLTHIIIPQGETFSFNSYCGPYSKENGYRSAPILSGESKMGYGGGTCQVCSTIYNIVLRIPSVIEDMNWHSQGGVSYLPSGFDATVSDTKDMVFRNILPYDLRLEFETQDGVMTALMYRAEESSTPGEAEN